MTRITREMETRANNMKPAYSMMYRDPTEVPPGVKREGYTCYWAAYTCRGESLYRVDELASWGWSLVSADRAKDATIDLLGNNPLAGKYICKKDTILMEAPDEIAKATLANDHRQAADTIRSMTHVTTDYVGYNRY